MMCQKSWGQRQFWQCLLGLLAILPSLGISDTKPLVYSYPTSGDPLFQNRDHYFVALLDLALAKTGQPYTLSPVVMSTMTEKRSTLFLKSERYNVHWLLTSEDLEQQLIPVRIPLYKGLIGWRLLVINEAAAPRFAGFVAVDQLKSLVATQGVGWPDTHILHSNGFNLRLAIDWPGLLDMVTRHNADYLPLALNDVWLEEQTLDERGLVVEQTLALQYPSAYYFFVSKTRPELARVLEKGLRLAVDDGSFDSLFKQTFGDAIKRSNLDQRRVFKLENPLLPAKTPLDDPRLWFVANS